MEKFSFRPIVLKVKTHIIAHKIMSLIILVAVALFGYWGYQKFTSTTGETRYVTATVQKGTIVSSITGSGQVSASNQLDIKPKVSGEVLWVGVKAGDSVQAGQALLTIDNTDAKKAITDAEQSLAEAKLQYQKDTVQAPIDYQKAVDALATAKDDLVTTYTDTFNTISNAYLDLPAVMTGMENVLHGYDLSTAHSQWNVDVLKNTFSDEGVKDIITVFAASAETDYTSAREKYDASLLAYKEATRYSKGDELETLLTQSLDTATAIAQALQSESNLLSSVTDFAQKYNRTLNPIISTMQTNVRSYLNTTNSTISALLTQKKSVDTAKQTITTDKQNITLLKVGNITGDNPISLQISEHSIANQEYNLAQLKSDLAEYTVVAPFAGTISAISLKPHDTASTGGAAATLITNQKIATLSLNEIDVAKIKIGDKTTLTLDALNGLTLTGSVSEIDPVGTVTQGVVSYTLKIVFDTQDEQVKPGMTVNAAIITDVKQGVLTVPASAIKNIGGTSYVDMFNPPLTPTNGSQGTVSVIPPRQQTVVTGMSNDTSTEIVSGLNEGDQVVTRTITTSPNTAATTQQAPSLFGGGNVRVSGGGGGTFRAGN